MGLLFGRKYKDATHDSGTSAPDKRAYDLVWDREIARLGQDEVVRRIAALNDFQSGRTGPSGFESWRQGIEREINKIAYEIAAREDG